MTTPRTICGTDTGGAALDTLAGAPGLAVVAADGTFSGYCGRVWLSLPLTISATAATIVTHALGATAMVNVARHEQAGRPGAGFGTDVAIATVVILLALVAHLVEPRADAPAAPTARHPFRAAAHTGCDVPR